MSRAGLARLTAFAGIALFAWAAALSEFLGGIALLLGVLKHEADIRTAVQQHAPDWSFDRMDPIARCTLLVGAYELLYGNDAPPPVVIHSVNASVLVPGRKCGTKWRSVPPFSATAGPLHCSVFTRNVGS